MPQIKIRLLMNFLELSKQRYSARNRKRYNRNSFNLINVTIMKTEMEKCLAGEWYDCHNQVFLDLKTRTHKLLMKYNSLPYEDKEEKHSLLKKMLGSIGMKVSVASPFICDYGCNIHIGNNNTGRQRRQTVLSFLWKFSINS